MIRIVQKNGHKKRITHLRDMPIPSLIVFLELYMKRTRMPAVSVEVPKRGGGVAKISR